MRSSKIPGGTIDIQKLKFPIGEFVYGNKYSMDETRRSIKKITALPEKITTLIRTFTEKQWNLSYRPGAWKALQLINHYVDVYINGYMRTKWLLIEADPIKPYEQDRMILLPDSRYNNTDEILLLLRLIIERWVYLLNSLEEGSFSKSIFHPEYDRRMDLQELIARYEWHGYHHLAHLEIIKRLG